MLAAHINQLGSSDEIRYGEVPDPVPGRGEVLVAVEASTVNHVDTFVRAGTYRTAVQFPFVVGRDLVGTVLDLGPGASGFAVGDRVWCNSLGHDGRQGAMAERAAVPQERLYHLPAGVDPLAAVTVLHPAATAFLGLVVHGSLAAGETVVVVGAAGGVGSAAVVIAQRLGAKVVAVARERDAAYCRSLGASAVIDPTGDLAARLAAAVPDGVDVWLDAAGVNDLAGALTVLRRRGRVVVLAGMSTEPQFTAGALYTKDISIHGFVISIAPVEELAAAAAMVNLLLTDGTLRSRRVVPLPMSRTSEAHRRIESGELHGARILLTPG